MNVLALCAGAGGLELGVKLAVPAASVVCYVEREAYAAAVLVARMGVLGVAPIWSDLRTFDGKPWSGVVDLVAAGYPCTGESDAGKRTGIDHDAWLWPEVWRVVREVGPRYVFLENVAAHLGRSFRYVVSDLAASGWRVEWDCVPAAAVGAPHIRDRVFLLATPNANRGGLQAIGFDELADETGRDDAHGCDRPLASMADASLVGIEQRGGIEFSEVSASQWNVHIRPPQPVLRGVDDGMANRLDRLYVCGNGVVPQAAARAIAVLWGRMSEHA